MDVSYELLNQFAKIIVGKEEKKENVNIGLYGTVEVDPVTEIKYVRLDGSSEKTPIYEAMDSINGDRVVCAIKNRKLVVTGNLTAPASARNATDFLKPYPGGGFLIGHLSSEGSPIVAYIVLKETEILFVSFNGKIMGSFSTKDIRLGSDETAVIHLCGMDSGGTISKDEKGFIFEADDYLEICTRKNNHNTKIISSSKNGEPYISTEIYDDNKKQSASAKLSANGLDIWIPDHTKAMVNGLPFIREEDSALTAKINALTKTAQARFETNYGTYSFERCGPVCSLLISNMKNLTLNANTTVLTNIPEEFLPIAFFTFLPLNPTYPPAIRASISAATGSMLAYYYNASYPYGNISETFSYPSGECYKILNSQ